MKMPESVTLEGMIWLEEWMDEGGPDLVQEVLGLCEAKDGAEIDELLQAGRVKSTARC